MVSWCTVRYLTAAPYEDAQSLSASQSAGRISKFARGFMNGTCDSSNAPSGLGYHDCLLVW